MFADMDLSDLKRIQSRLAAAAVSAAAAKRLQMINPKNSPIGGSRRYIEKLEVITWNRRCQWLELPQQDDYRHCQSTPWTATRRRDCAMTSPLAPLRPQTSDVRACADHDDRTARHAASAENESDLTTM